MQVSLGFKSLYMYKSVGNGLANCAGEAGRRFQRVIASTGGAWLVSHIELSFWSCDTDSTSCMDVYKSITQANCSVAHTTVPSRIHASPLQMSQVRRCALATLEYSHPISLQAPLTRDNLLETTKGTWVAIPDLYALFPGWEFDVNTHYDKALSDVNECIRRCVDMTQERVCDLTVPKGAS